jgi:hypothetical protein
MNSDHQHNIREEICKANPLASGTRLSNIYHMPPLRDRLHIVVSYPRKESHLVCWIVENKHKSHMFSITVDNSLLVGDLRPLLKKESLVPKNIEMYDLSLWRVRLKIQQFKPLLLTHLGFHPY